MQTSSERFSKIKKKGITTHISDDLYHQLMKISWLSFVFLFFLFFILFNFIFALIYYNIPNSIAGSTGSLFDCFSFSVQTFSTIGYGMYAPNTTSTHVVTIVESMFSVLVTALFTGLAFAKFARPNALVMFSKNVLITKYDGKPTLIIRLGNLRGNQILEASIRLIILTSYTSPEGIVMRRQYDLHLIRDRTTFFALSWTVMHVIDEKSPFYKLTKQDLIEKNIELAVSATGHDETFSQTVYANCIYSPEDFVFDKQFVDVIISNNSRVEAVDYGKFHELV